MTYEASNLYVWYKNWLTVQNKMLSLGYDLLFHSYLYFVQVILM